MRDFLALVAALTCAVIGSWELQPKPTPMVAPPPPPASAGMEIPLKGHPPAVVQTGWLGPDAAAEAREQVKPQLSQQCGPGGCPAPSVQPTTTVEAVSVPRSSVVRGSACGAGGCGSGRVGFFGRVFGRR